MSLALEICRIAEDHVGRDRLPRVREVGVLVGTDGAVEPDSLEFCLDVLLSAPPFAGARVAMEMEPGDELRLTYLEIDDGDPPHRGP